MTIGLPKAMLYYRYQVLWETFFSRLGCRTVVSEESNKKILEDGICFSIDENCLPAKIHMGHVRSLIGRCDYILVPRVVSYGKSNDVCVKFNAAYDIVRNTFAEAPLLHYNIDLPRGAGEQRAFIKMGRTLGFGGLQSWLAYRAARAAQTLFDRQRCDRQEKLLKDAGHPRILIVSHPYNCYDRLIGYPVERCIRALGGVAVYADAVDRRRCLKKARELSPSLYWRYNRELIGAVGLLEDEVDGMVFLTAFPCGPDSLVNEVMLRRPARKPAIQILMDELQGGAGLQTRLESFLDILSMRAAAQSGRTGAIS